MLLSRRFLFFVGIVLLSASQVWAQLAVPTFDASVVAAPSTPSRGGEVLYDQTANPGSPTTENFPSQEFEDQLSQYDSQGADDFTVPVGETWAVGVVEVLGGYRENEGPAEIVDVYFYADDAGQPGAAVATYTSVSVDDSDLSGDFAAVLPEPANLTEGTYWVSVVVDMDRTTVGQWFWNKQVMETVAGAELHWRNPNDGFMTGCTDWGALVAECGDDGGRDASFRLLAPPPISNEDGATPTEFIVSQNYPNPFAAETTVEFGVPAAQRVTVAVYDLLGRQVEVLTDAVRSAGYHRVTWDATGVPNGVYFCRVESGDRSRTLRMTVAR